MQHAPGHADGGGPGKDAGVDAWLERLTVFVAATGLSGLGLALAGRFVAISAVLLGLLATALYHAALPAGESRGAAARADAAGAPVLRWRHLLPVLLLALLFRLAPYPYVLGGQDQGVYTNVAAHLVRTQGIAVDDPAWARLAGGTARATYIADNFTDPFLPGVYTLPGREPTFVFQFYHLFPVWLAIFGGLFGIGAAVYGLSFLSLLSVVFFQRLAISITGSERVGLAAGLLFAVNPLLAFFSKFPLTEIPTLAFSLAGFAWLARYAQCSPQARRARWLWLSAIAFACLFLTRLSGFMYLPILCALAWLPRLFDADTARARAVARWAYATIGLYAVSIAYGLVFSRPYSLKVYEQSFALAAGPSWPAVLLAIAAAAAAASVLLARLPRDGVGIARLRRLVERGEALLGPTLLLVLALGAWKLWQLGFGTHYLHDAWLQQFPGVAGSGWSSLAHGSLVVAAIHLCPLLAIAYVLLAQRRWSAPGARLLLTFVLCFVTYAALLNWTVPYQPYYARYLASELVPYVLLFTTCCMAWLDSAPARRVLGAVLLVSGVYGAALSTAQLGRIDNAGALESIGRLAAIAGDGDVLLLDGSPGQGFESKQVKTTLAYTFGRNVVTAGSLALGDIGFLEGVAGAYDHVYFVSSAASAPAGFSPIGTVRLHANGFLRGARPPGAYGPVLDALVRVYRLDKVDFAPGRRLSLQVGQDARVLSQVGRRQPGLGLVADGRAGYLAYGPYAALPPGDYQLRLRGSRATQGVRIDVAIAGGAQVLAAGAAHPAGANGVFASFPFSVPAPGARDLEVRVLVPDGAGISLHDYTIQRLR